VAEAAAPGDSTGAQDSSVARRRRWTLFLGTAGLVVVLDQLTKVGVDSLFALASRSIPAGQPGGPTELVGEYIRIAKTYNDGAIFGLFDTTATLMALLTLGVVAGLVLYVWRKGAEVGSLVIGGLGLVLGGAIGNLIDRVRLGYVIDFVDMGVGDARWYAWNIADAAVFLGIVALFAAALLGDRAGPKTGPASGAT